MNSISPVVLFVGGPKHLQTEQISHPQAYLQMPEAELRTELGEIEFGVITEGLTLSQLMREGTRVTTQAMNGWGDGINTACALSAAELAAKARKLI